MIVLTCLFVLSHLHKITVLITLPRVHKLWMYSAMNHGVSTLVTKTMSTNRLLGTFHKPHWGQFPINNLIPPQRKLLSWLLDDRLLVFEINIIGIFQNIYFCAWPLSVVGLGYTSMLLHITTMNLFVLLYSINILQIVLYLFLHSFSINIWTVSIFSYYSNTAMNIPHVFWFYVFMHSC